MNDLPAASLAEPGLPERVALFMPSFKGGGAERDVLHFAKGFIQRGVAADVVVASARGPYREALPKQVRLIDLKAWKTSTSLPALLQYLRRERPQALMSTLVDADTVALIARRIIRDMPLVVRVVNTFSSVLAFADFKDRMKLNAWKRLLPIADAIISNSCGVKADLQERIPGISHVEAIHNPVIWPDIGEQAAEPVEHPWFEDGQPPVILCAGRLEPVKGHEVALRALAEILKSRRVRLVVLGEGPLLGELQALAKRLKIADSVDFAGFRPNPFAYMAKAAALVLASRHEGLGNVLIQALACGTPIVSTDCPFGPREIMEDGKWGRLVPVGDWRALARAILETLDHPPAPELLIARASRYDADASIDAHLRLLAAQCSSG